MEECYGAGKEAGRRAVFQRRYLSRLVAVLHRARIETATSASARIRVVKLAADLSLAMSSRGRTSWSRAILGKYIFRLKKSGFQLRVVKSRGNLHARRRSAYSKSRQCRTNIVCKKFSRRLFRPVSGTGHNYEEGGGSTVASRMKTLRLLVPGSRGLDTPVFLKEAADYISALKKQVQAMQALADCCSNSNAHATCQV